MSLPLHLNLSLCVKSVAVIAYREKGFFLTKGHMQGEQTGDWDAKLKDETARCVDNRSKKQLQHNYHEM